MDSVDGIANGGLLEQAATGMQDILTAGKQHLGQASNQTQPWRGISSVGEAGEEALGRQIRIFPGSERTGPDA